MATPVHEAATRVHSWMGASLLYCQTVFTVRGRVAQGDQRGRSIGFPTANLETENEVLPARGVYGGHLLLLDDGDPRRGARLPAVINVGSRPTFETPGTVLAEAHVIDWSGDLYGRRLDLSFELRLRAERRFPGADALARQIAADVEECRRRLEAL